MQKENTSNSYSLWFEDIHCNQMHCKAWEHIYHDFGIYVLFTLIRNKLSSHGQRWTFNYMVVHGFYIVHDFHNYPPWNQKLIMNLRFIQYFLWKFTMISSRVEFVSCLCPCILEKNIVWMKSHLVPRQKFLEVVHVPKCVARCTFLFFIFLQPHNSCINFFSF